MKFDHVLLIGFGGPTKLEEVEPFLREVAKGTRIPEARLKEVYHHYERIGGASPYGGEVLRFSRELEKRLRSNGNEWDCPVFFGMKNWHPFLKDVIQEIKRKGLRHGLGIILAPHRSDASFDKYIRSLDEAKALNQAEDIRYDFLKPWYTHPFFIQAQAERIKTCLKEIQSRSSGVHLLFTAHSIPLSMAQQCRYAGEVEESSALVAKELSCSQWSVAYQSRSGNPKDPWLEPDVFSRLRDLKRKGARGVILIPIGFLSENAEILYDLDIEAKEEMERLGLRYLRAQTVLQHPQFIGMMQALIRSES